jgi:transposase InsO family protein
LGRRISALADWLLTEHPADPRGTTGTVGDGLDNAMCESLIGTMRIEKLNRQPWRSVEDVRAAVFHWIESWYNRRRRHSSLGYLSPLEYESQHHDGHAITNP